MCHAHFVYHHVGRVEACLMQGLRICPESRGASAGDGGRRMWRYRWKWMQSMLPSNSRCTRPWPTWLACSMAPASASCTPSGTTSIRRSCRCSDSAGECATSMCMSSREMAAHACVHFGIHASNCHPRQVRRIPIGKFDYLGALQMPNQADLVACDARLANLLGEKVVKLASLSERIGPMLTRVPTPMLDYTIRLASPPPLEQACRKQHASTYSAWSCLRLDARG